MFNVAVTCTSLLSSHHCHVNNGDLLTFKEQILESFKNKKSHRPNLFEFQLHIVKGGTQLCKKFRKQRKYKRKVRQLVFTLAILR